MDTALTVIVVVGVVALAAAGAAAFYSWSRRSRVFQSQPARTIVERTSEAPLRAGEPAGRTVEEERVRRTVREPAPPAGMFARDDLDDPVRRPPL